ncbi:GTP binding domain, P-loop containing nucleoside triphosphate hydrolase [Tanacetum coccineum]
MGGDTVSSPSSSDDDINWGGFTDSESSDDDYRSFEVEENERRKKASYEQVVKSYDELKDRVVSLELAKTKILSYTPGSWVENVGGMTVNDYNVPKTTTLLLIGPKGSGKSSLVNRISRVFEDDKFAPERAQVTYNSSAGDGTCFLREYMIPRNSTSFCLYDTRSFSNDLYENLQMIRQWMTKGVRHGKLVKSASDDPNFQARMKHKCGRDKLLSYESRTINFVIFVVNGLSVLKCMNSDGSDTLYTQMVANTFSSQFLSFKDHKPAIAITHADLLSISERARVRVYLGELLGVHPSKQTFDIPDDCEPTTELTIVDMVRYALEHADRNLPRKTQPKISKARKIYGSNIQLWTCLLLLLAAGMFIFRAHHQGFCSPKAHQEKVPEPRPEIKKSVKVQPNVVLEPNPEVKKVMEVHPESIYKKIKKSMEVQPEIVLEPILEINKVMEVHQESILKPIPKIKEVHRQGVREPMEKKKPSLERKKVMKVQPKSVPGPSLEKKKESAEKVHRRGQKIKKGHAGRVPEPAMEIDWKKIRHLWYK